MENSGKYLQAFELVFAAFAYVLLLPQRILTANILIAGCDRRLRG
jgi:hypothetical protein